MNRIISSGLFFLCLIPQWLLALPEDKQQPATITADSAILNRKDNSGLFTGHVIVIQGTTRLTADKLVTHGTQTEQIRKAVAYGKPARYQTLPKPDDKIFYASADQIIDDAESGNITLIGHAELHQGTNTFTAPYIVYNRNTGVITSKPSKKQRTTIIMQPDNLPHISQDN